MPEVHSIHATSSLHRTTMYGEHHAVSLMKGHYHRAGLHSGPLLRHNELAAGEVPTGLGQKNGKLEGEHMLAIEIPMQAIVIVSRVPQQEGRGPCLSRVVTSG